MNLPITHCDRCGYPVAMHYQPEHPKRWTGCPLPPGSPVPKATCAFQGCYAEQDDPLYGLCPQHGKQAWHPQYLEQRPARRGRFAQDLEDLD